jgi:ADP-heptose:LPS heptosyltransferase
VPALRALERAHAQRGLVLAAPEALRPLVDWVAPAWELLPAEPLQPLPPEAGAAEVAVNLHGRGPESHAVLLSTSPARLIAFAHDDVPESRGGPEWRPGEHEVTRWCRLLAESGVSADPVELSVAPPGVPPPAEAVGATLVHPGAAAPARRWPSERFAAVARTERAAGRPVVVTGSSREVDLARRVAEQAGLPPSAVLAGRTDLAGLGSAVAAAARVVCGDTGVAHLATALGTPSAILFGPTSPGEWGPPAERIRHRVLWAGGTGDPHGATPDPGLLEITTEEVLAALEELPDR